MLDANPHLTRQELRDVLTGTAVDLGVAGVDPIYGFGRVDAEAARIAGQAVTDVTAPAAWLESPIDTQAWPVPSLRVKFSEPLASGPAGTAANYALVGAGADNTFGNGDDLTYTLDISYDADSRTTVLTPTAPSTTLPLGQYRLTLDATGGLMDEAGNALNGGVDQVLAFAIDTKSTIVAQPFVNGGSAAVAVHTDGTAVVVQPGNPLLSGYYWPQLLVDQFDPGGADQGAFRSIPTNIYDSYAVSNIDVAVSDSGGMVVYADMTYPGGGGEPRYFDVTLQALDVDGRAAGPRTLVSGVYGNSSTGTIPHLDMNASGAFVVVYSGLKSTSDGYPAWVFARLYDAGGSPLGASFDVGQTVGGAEADVAIAADGSSLFVWVLNGSIMARRFDSSGVAIDDETVLASPPATERYTQPRVVRKADGTFIVTWWSTYVDSFSNPPSLGVFAQQFSATGIALAPAIPVFVKGIEPQIALADDGRFAIAYSCPDSGSDPDTNDDGLFVQRFNPDGTFLGTRLWVTGQTTGAQKQARLAMLGDGRMVVAWNETNGVAKLRYYDWNRRAKRSRTGRTSANLPRVARTRPRWRAST